MNVTKQNLCGENFMNAPKPMAVLALLTEMARRLNANISKVELRPLDEALSQKRKAAPKDKH
jgi:hypothetical protein